MNSFSFIRREPQQQTTRPGTTKTTLGQRHQEHDQSGDGGIADGDDKEVALSHYIAILEMLRSTKSKT